MTEPFNPDKADAQTGSMGFCEALSVVTGGGPFTTLAPTEVPSYDQTFADLTGHNIDPENPLHPKPTPETAAVAFAQQILTAPDPLPAIDQVAVQTYTNPELVDAIQGRLTQTAVGLATGFWATARILNNPEYLEVVPYLQEALAQHLATQQT